MNEVSRILQLVRFRESLPIKITRSTKQFPLSLLFAYSRGPRSMLQFCDFARFRSKFQSSSNQGRVAGTMERQLDGYRLYFLDERGAILVRKDFEASDDHQALHIARLAARLFSVTCREFALWQGKRQIWQGRLDAVEPGPGTSDDRKLDVEEVLQKSRWCLAASQRILAELSRVAPSRPAKKNGEGAA